MGSGFPSRSLKNHQAFLKQLYDLGLGSLVGNALLGKTADQIWYCDSTNGSDNNDGRTAETAFATITKAVNMITRGDVILVAPGQYDEAAAVTIPRTSNLDSTTLNNITIIGLGGRGAAYIEHTTEDLDGMNVHADDVTIINLGISAEDTTAGNVALTVTGSRFRAYSCKIEGGESQVIVGPGTDAQITAGTRGRGGDIAFIDCEFCWGTFGVVVTSSDYGSCTQLLLQDCWFHNITDTCLDEDDAGGNGSGKDIWVRNCTFGAQEDGTEATAYVDLDSANTTGHMRDCHFVTTVYSTAKVAIASGVLTTGWRTEREGGPATGGTNGRPD